MPGRVETRVEFKTVAIIERVEPSEVIRQARILVIRAFVHDILKIEAQFSSIRVAILWIFGLRSGYDIRQLNAAQKRRRVQIGLVESVVNLVFYYAFDQIGRTLGHKLIYVAY